MKYRWRIKILAAGLVLALMMTIAGAAEETLAFEPEGAPNAASNDAYEITDAPQEHEAADAMGEVSLFDLVVGAGGEAQRSDDPEPTAAPQDAGEPPEDAEPGDTRQEPGLTLGVGEKVALGDGASGYASDAPKVASVSAKKGVVTAKKVGVAHITATAADGTPTVRTVTVMKAPKKLTLSESSLELRIDQSVTLQVQLPKKSAASQITYSSSRPDIASVDGAGVVQAKKPGRTVITAKAYNGVKATCKVKVLKAPSKVTLSAESLVLCLNESAVLEARLPKGSATALTWQTSDPAVVIVDGSGALRPIGAGTATVTVTTDNGKRDACEVRVLNGAAPTVVLLDADSLTLGAGEKVTLSPSVGTGEITDGFAFQSSDKSVAKVSAKGIVTAKKRGAATITVKAHNGVSATVSISVLDAPEKVTLNYGSVTMHVGGAVELKARVSPDDGYAVKWKSSNPEVAAVDDTGAVVARSVGKAEVYAETYNGVRSPKCKITVRDGEGGVDTVPYGKLPSTSKMLSNLRKSGVLGSKTDAIVSVVKLLINAGFEPAYAAGVAANVYAEGTYGYFESSRYIANPTGRPRYFCYLDGGEYYSWNGTERALTAIYMSQEELDAYTGEVEGRLRFAEESFYLDSYSGKYAQNIDLNALEELMVTLEAGQWEGKFGLGIVQWTGTRTKQLVALYRKHAGADSDHITASQVVAAENEMIVNELKGNYRGVYNAWLNDNPEDERRTDEAARSAGALVCTRYEIPANASSQAVTRGSKAAEIFRAMIGQ